ncbi:hypothetical protein AVEN_52493-1 [Araneus ventricosus]|uniref:Uncharacterized protein n=1 Tax=Araneus ventricosus TaxID=182803 RepID=A0A4Y2VGT8_ARAVE|nr:hypothetical protein AVEN_52493-1 [Araneus ventricosus]
MYGRFGQMVSRTFAPVIPSPQFHAAPVGRYPSRPGPGGSMPSSSAIGYTNGFEWICKILLNVIQLLLDGTPINSIHLLFTEMRLSHHMSGAVWASCLLRL